MILWRRIFIIIAVLMDWTYANIIDNVISELATGITLSSNVLDYAITKIIDEKSKLSSGKLYIFVGHDLLPAIENPDRYLDVYHILRTNPLKGKVLIIPKFDRSKNRWKLIIVDTRKQQFEYYTFGDGNFENSRNDWTNIILKFLTRRNIFVDPTENINTNSWREVAPRIKVTPVYSWQNNSGVAVIMVVDYMINGHFKFKNFVSLYRCKLRQKATTLQTTSNYTIERWFKGCNQFGKGLKLLKIGTSSKIKEAIGLLSDNGNVSFFEVDYAVKKIIDYQKILAKGNKFLYITAELSTDLIRYQSRITELQQSEFIKLDINGKILIMPIWNAKGHWEVFCADLNEKLFEFYEPLDPLLESNKVENYVKKHLTSFLKILGLRNWFVSDSEKITNFDNWKIIAPTVQLPAQHDFFNCGVFVIMFIDYRINGKLLFGDNVNKYRRALWERVIDLNGNPSRKIISKLKRIGNNTVEAA